MTGVHTINITYCECDPTGPGVLPRVQLLRARWFPATWRWPSTAFTFRLLNFLHKLQAKCKINLYDFHTTITSIFDNAGLEKPLVGTPFTHPIVHNLLTACSSGTTSFPWYSGFMCTCANSDGAVARMSSAGSLPYRRELWPSNVQRVHILVGTSNSRRVGSLPDHCKFAFCTPHFLYSNIPPLLFQHVRDIIPLDGREF